jgi:hypothetical protein
MMNQLFIEKDKAEKSVYRCLKQKGKQQLRPELGLISTLDLQGFLSINNGKERYCASLAMVTFSKPSKIAVLSEREF